jgi:hypothetical protein
MKLKLKHLVFFIALLGISAWGPFTSPFSFSTITASENNPDSREWVAEELRVINPQAGNLNPDVLKLSLNAYIKARHQGLDEKQLLTIIDYSKPSTERRLWVVDLKRGKILFNTWVSHGKNSGNINATSFSNQPGSLKSSIGVFLTEATYMGGNGYSLRLSGLEHGINDNALRRDIVMHGAWYVNPNVIEKYGQIGRSWGCPAVSPSLAQPLIDTIKNKTLVVVYYPDQNWLNKSTYLATG